MRISDWSSDVCSSDLKVFSQLGRWKQHKKDGKPVLIGVGGCVASQEGEAIVKRAPYVDLVFGPQTLHRLPQLIDAQRASGKPQDRKSVVSGKSGSVRVDLGGRRSIKKKKKTLR